MWLRKKTQKFPTSCASFNLSPHDQVGRLCVYGIYKRTSKALTKQSTIVLTAVDVGGKNTQEQDKIRIWAAPTASSGTRTVLQGILGRWGEMWPQQVKGPWQHWLKKSIYHSYALTFSVRFFFFSFLFFFFPPSPWLPIVVVNFIVTMKSN